MARSRRTPDARGGWHTLGRLPASHFCVLSALVIAPPFLALIYALGDTTHLRYLLYPSLAAIGYDLFIRDPTSLATTLRNAVFGPIVAAALGMGVMLVLSSGPLRVFVVTVLTIVVMRLLNIVLASTLSVALLTPLAGAETPRYLVSIAASSLVLTLAFRTWRHFLYLPLYGCAAPEQQSAQLTHE
ncbi:MAG: hypothetical protein ACXWQR_22540 [Ktedonobacterales bacterium]